MRDYYRDQEREKVARSSGQRISISVSSGGSNKDTDDAISAAILAKVSNIDYFLVSKSPLPPLKSCQIFVKIVKLNYKMFLALRYSQFFESS